MVRQTVEGKRSMEQTHREPIVREAGFASRKIV